MSDHVRPRPSQTRAPRDVTGSAVQNAVRLRPRTWQTSFSFFALFLIGTAAITTWAQRDSTAEFLGVHAGFESLDPVGATACAAAITVSGIVIWFLLTLVYQRLPLPPASRAILGSFTAALLTLGGLAVSATWAADWMVDLHFHAPMSVQVTTDTAVCPPSPGPDHACMVVAMNGHEIVTRWIDAATGQLGAAAWQGPLPQAGLSDTSLAVPQVLAVVPIPAS